jgi:outer membrane protein assembly factor BamB
MLVLMTAALVLTVLISTNTWNPLPQLVAWWGKVTQMSEPAPAWETRLGGVPDLAGVTITGQVVLATRGLVEGYDRSSGQRLWHHDADWALPAGDVVVLRPRPAGPDVDRAPDTGYSVVEPASGTVVWGDREAIAVWAYADLIIDLVCPPSGDCRLRGRRHGADGQLLWAVPLPGSARTITGPNPGLATTREPADWFARAALGSPGPAPPVIGIPLDGRIHVVDTVDGRKLREVAPPDRQTRIVVAGERLIMAHAEPGEAGCRYRVEALDPRDGSTLWRAEALDIDTAEGAGCEARRDPLGAGNYLVGVRADNHPVLVSMADGRTVWIGVPGERILDTDGQLAVVESADRKTINVVDLLAADRPVVWSGDVGPKPRAAVTQAYVFIAGPERLVVLGHLGPTVVATVRTKATVVGYGLRGVVLASARRIGFLPLQY